MAQTPMLLLDENGGIPSETRDYLELVQPGLGAPDGLTFNHGWSVGDEASIPTATQLELERLLQPTD